MKPFAFVAVLLLAVIAYTVSDEALRNHQKEEQAKAFEKGRREYEEKKSAAVEESREETLERLRREGNDMFGAPRRYGAKIIGHFGNNGLVVRGESGTFVLEGHPRAGAMEEGEIIWFYAWNTGPANFSYNGGTRTMDRYAFAIAPQKTNSEARPADVFSPQQPVTTAGLVTRVGPNTYIAHPADPRPATPSAADQQAEILRKYGAAR